MPKVFVTNAIALRPGVQADEFERFVREEINASPWPDGIHVSLLKGDRGDREGKYLVLLQFDSVERRDWASPAIGQLSAEYLQMIEPKMAALEKWGTLASGPLAATFTEYVVVSE
jgi:hypothetical protein